MPFDIAQTARALKESAALKETDGAWVIDDARAAALGHPSLTLGIGRRIGELSSEARALATAAALWSDAPPLSGLSAALALDERMLRARVGELITAGLVARSADGDIRFNHDRLREEVLRQPAAEDVRRLAGEMAERLARAETQDAATAATTLHLRCTAGLEEADPTFWRDRFASGALTARRQADLDAAGSFAEAAWTLRERVCGDDPSADQLLLHEAVLAAADRQQPDAVMHRARLLIDRAPDQEALGAAYVVAMAALRLAGDPDAAWTMAVEGLGRFGVRVPQTVTQLDLLGAVLRWRIGGRIGNSRSSDGAAKGLTKVGEAAATLAFERSPADAGIVALRSSTRAGRSERRASFWASVGAFLSSMTGDYVGAARSASWRWPRSTRFEALARRPCIAACISA